MYIRLTRIEKMFQFPEPKKETVVDSRLSQITVLTVWLVVSKSIKVPLIFTLWSTLFLRQI